MENYRIKSLPKEAMDKITQLKAANESYEEFFKAAQDNWTDKFQELTTPISKELSISTLKDVDYKQSMSLSYRGEIAKEIAIYQNKLNREDVFLKEDELDSVIFLVSGKTNFKLSNARQINIFLDSVNAERSRACAIIKSYIAFLRDTNQNLKDYQFNIKHIIELMKLLNS